MPALGVQDFRLIAPLPTPKSASTTPSGTP